MQDLVGQVAQGILLSDVQSSRKNVEALPCEDRSRLFTFRRLTRAKHHGISGCRELASELQTDSAIRACYHDDSVGHRPSCSQIVEGASFITDGVYWRLSWTMGTRVKREFIDS